MIYPPTDEQIAAMDLVRSGGRNVAIEALAGTGKTTTLRLIAETEPGRTFAYVAFNKAIVTEAKETMPTNVRAATAHSLAYRAIGRHYAHRLGAHRMRSQDIARTLRIEPLVLDTDHGRRPLSPSWLAGLTIRTIRRFTLTADPAPGPEHVPHLDGIDAEGDWTYTRQVAAHLAPAITAAWADATSPAGTLPYSPNYYLKLWQLSDPRIDADAILYDEAQDANGAMLDIVHQQDHAQLVFVGDRYQQIYEWNGAVNAMSSITVDDRTWLTNSFRFGPEIAAVANRVLRLLDAPTEANVIGRGADGAVAETDRPDVYLTRTNAAAVIRALRHLDAGGRPAIVGGADEVVKFALAAQALQRNQPTDHPELACFVNWNQVLAYVEDDQLGGDLQLLVGLVEDFGTEKIISGLGATVKEADADLVISTAHKSKGRQWPTVQLADDFPDDQAADRPPTAEEYRLLYVAVTRAQHHLDATRVPTVTRNQPATTTLTEREGTTHVN